MIEAHDLRRTYKTSTGTFRRRSLEVEAVRGVTFSVEQGELFGLLGPNGAGKTTTIKMLITLLHPDVGIGARPRLRRRQATRARSASGSATSSAATAASTTGSRRSTTCATSPSSTRCRRASSGARIAELLELVGLAGREKRARRGLLARHAAAPAHRARPAARPAGRVPRRADDRSRPGRRARAARARSRSSSSPARPSC